MTAVEEFFNGKNKISDNIHNSQIIIERMEEINGTSQFFIDRLDRRIKKSAVDTLPVVDTFLDFFQISILETILRFFDMRVKELIVGRERIPEEAVIFAPNHETETEHLYLARACCPRRDLDYPFRILKFLNPKRVAKKKHVPIFFAKYQLFNMPIVSTLFSSTAFPVEREIKDTRSLEIGSRFLQRGSNILIYPEGTRNLEKKAKPKSGAVRLAIQNKVPIIPVGHVGLWELTKGSFVPSKNGYWYCEYGEPIYYDKYYDKEVDYLTLRELTDQLMDEIDKLKENGRRKIKELNEIKDNKAYSGSVNEVVVHKFNKLNKVPNNPIDSLFRNFINFTSKIPIIGERIDSFFHFLVRLGVDSLINPLTFDVKINGKENLEGVRPAVLCSNHESFLEIGLYGLYLIDPKMSNYFGYLLPGEHNSIDKTWFMMKKELAEMPIVSSWTLSAGGFPVRRGERDKEAMRVAEELIKRNRNVVMFPQQTTYPEIDVDSGKTGAVRLAIDTKRPVIPVSIKGSHNAMKRGVLQLLFPPKAFPIEINIGKPIYYEEYYDKEPTYEELKTLTRDLMIKIKDMQDKKIIEYKESDNRIHSPVDWIFKQIGRLVGLPRRNLQDSTRKLPFEEIVNKITDSAGITSTVSKKDKSKEPVSLNIIDSYLLRLKKQGEKLGLFPLLDDLFYSFTKRSLDLLVKNLYNFKVEGAENIPNGDVGVILLAQSGSQLDLVIGSCIIPEKVHFMIDSKTYKMPFVSTLLQSLGFFRQSVSQTDFGPLLHVRDLLKSKKIVGIFPQIKGKENMIKYIAGILKMAIDGKPTVIVPLAIKGTETPIPPVNINVAIGKPIGPFKRMKREKRYELAEEIYENIKNVKTQAYQMRR
ncbi:MAG: lysophospholipid acyltransferase family protein [Candidatus Hodarchaeota archaeon]